MSMRPETGDAIGASQHGGQRTPRQTREMHVKIPDEETRKAGWVISRHLAGSPIADWGWACG